MQQHHCAGVGPRQQLGEGLLPGGLGIVVPVHVGKAPENRPVAQLLRHAQVFLTVYSLRRAVVFGHVLTGGVIDIHGVSVLADYFVIADGSNASQVKAMADNVEEELGKAGHECRQIEGYQTAGWILMDYGDLIVHIFSRDDRLFYDLERIWRDGKVVENVEEL